MATKWDQAGHLWPGMIAVNPFNKYEGIYRAESKLFDSYKEAEQWVLSKKSEEIKLTSSY